MSKKYMRVQMRIHIREAWAFSHLDRFTHRCFDILF